MPAQDFLISPIRPADNATLAHIIRRTLEEFGANHPGTVYFDEETDRLSAVFETRGSAYFVATTKDGKLVGGAGIFPTPNLPPGTCELVKMYLLPEARGTGLGKRLMQTCLHEARRLGYSRVYLETMPELKLAIALYEHMGFAYLPAPLGSSGHFGCAIQMLKAI